MDGEHNALGISVSARKKEDKDMKSIVLEEPRLHKSTLSHKMACEQIVPKQMQNAYPENRL